MPLELVIADRRGVDQAILRGALDRNVTPRPIKKLPTLQFGVRPDNAAIVWLTQGEKTLIKAYDRDIQAAPLFVGPVVALEKDLNDQGGKVAVTCAGGGWRLGFRLLGKTVAGWSYGTALSTVGRGAAMAKALDDVNAEVPTGIVRGTIAADSSFSYFGPHWEKPVLDFWQETGATLDGPDWEVEPLDVQADGSIGKLNIAPAFGANQLNAVWELGTGKNNVKTLNQKINSGTLANRARSTPPGWPDNTPAGLVVQEFSDQASIADRGLYEVPVASDLTVNELRANLVANHVAVRRVPSQVIAFQPRMDAQAPSGLTTTPEALTVQDLVYRTHYFDGDLIRLHAREKFPVYDDQGLVRIGTQELDTVDAVFRIYAVTLVYDENNNRTPSFQLVGSG